MATHASRDTTTGILNEKEIEQFLIENISESVNAQVIVGKKRNGGKHITDLLIGGETYTPPKKKRPTSTHKGGTLVSLKYQEIQGTAEEKIPFEIMKLQHCIDDYGYDCAIMVLCGDTGWKWKDYFLSEEFRQDMKKIYPDVSIVSQEQFMKLFSK